LEDYDKKNGFDVERYIKRRGKAKLRGETVITKL
jgi:traG family protein